MRQKAPKSAVEGRTKVQIHVWEHTFFHQKQRNEKPPDASVSIEERVDALKLVMDKCSVNENVGLIVSIHIFLKVGLPVLLSYVLSQTLAF